MKYLRLYVKNIQIITILLFLFSFGVSAQENGKTLYNQIKTFNLNGGKADVSNLVLKRDRVEMTFNGTFYFPAPINGKVTGAVFIGQGNFKAEVPASEFEKNNVKRMLNAELVESDFKTAVFRFTDDTFDIIGKSKTEGAASAEVQKIAAEIDNRLMKETGANISARLAISILNKENPGFFFANFDGGKRDRFSYILDHQNRIPTEYFTINGGEKGIIFSYSSTSFDNDIWMAFYSLEDYQRKIVSYSDINDLVDVTHYKLDLDLRQPKRKLGLKANVSMTALQSGIKAVPFVLGESLGEYEDTRLKKQLRVKNVRLGSETLNFSQEDWEGGLTVFLSKDLQKDEKIELEMEMEGDFVQQPQFFENCHYPRSTTDWYPRHGYLDRSTFEMSFSHPKDMKIATNGVRLSEELSADDKNTMVTKYKMDHQVSLITFAMAQFKRYTEEIKWDTGEKPTILEYNSLTEIPIKEDFIMAELNNAVRNFHFYFGKYPYETYGAAFHPFGFGQGFPSMVMIPGTDRANKYTYAFISHETAHQWWGNIVAWRSYRDQWLSEG
ncbi:MAG TPA: M1 family aminopeptidase, partial [Pyrinomonadaceae bacterium]|nr:M1 family aminopeptidase [Pyrinomonadaceae bacterium]